MPKIVAAGRSTAKEKARDMNRPGSLRVVHLDVTKHITTCTFPCWVDFPLDRGSTISNWRFSKLGEATAGLPP